MTIARGTRIEEYKIKNHPDKIVSWQNAPGVNTSRFSIMNFFRGREGQNWPVRVS